MALHLLSGASGQERSTPRGAGLVRYAGTALAPSGRRGRLVILIYHQVLEAPDPLRPGAITRAEFAWQMATLSACFNVLPLDEAVQRLGRGALPPRAVAITFDDGYRDNVNHALPILQANGVTATFFVTSGTLGAYMWNDAVIEAVRSAPEAGLDASWLGLSVLPSGNDRERVAALYRVLSVLKTWEQTPRDEAIHRLLEQTGAREPNGLMMHPADVRALPDAGMSVGAHTVNHPILSRTPPSEARREIAEGRDALNEICGREITLFAYPNGRPNLDYDDTHARLVKELGFRAAVSTAWGANRGTADPFQLRRCSAWDRTPERFAVRLLYTAMRG